MNPKEMKCVRLSNKDLCRGPPHGQLKNCICGSSGKEICYWKMLCSFLRIPDTSASHASASTRLRQHVPINASTPTRLNHNASPPTRPHQHVYTNASEPQRVSANTSATNAPAAPTRLLWPARMYNFSQKLGFRSRPLQKSRKNVKRNHHLFKK